MLFLTMLRELKIKNFAIVDNLSIEFRPGLNIMSGETGAGKSLVIGALELLLGARAQSDQIMTGADAAEVQAFFDVEDVPLLRELGIDGSDGLIIRRVISSNGKGRAYINDTMTNVRTLDELGRSLVDIHGQHDHQKLTSAERQLEFVDAYGQLAEPLKVYQDLFREVRGKEGELHRLREQSMERSHRTDLLQFQVKEIESAELRTGELEDLEEERKILFNAAKLRELCEHAYSLIYEGEASLVENITTILSHLRAIAEYDSSAGEPLELLDSASPLISDAAAAIRDMRERYDVDPSRLEAVEKRLDTLHGLRKKYGHSEEEMLQYLEQTRSELEGLESSDERIEELSEQIVTQRAQMLEMAEAISSTRKKACTHIESMITERLSELAFKKPVFRIGIETLTDEKGEPRLGPNGSDSVEFLFSANPSVPPKPLKRVASGGELSRVMLAIKSVFAAVDDTPVMIFDEIDAGIGGKTAVSVGQSLKTLSAGHQVLCITHLAQIASRADAHFSIQKGQGAKKVDIRIQLLEGDDRVREIARMLSGKVTETSLKHSEELLAARER